MASPKSSSSSGSSSKSKLEKRIAQTSEDARLHAAFEESGECGEGFHYRQSVIAGKQSITAPQEVIAYLQRIQRGGFTQSFGCMITVEEESFRVIAYSENAPEMLDAAVRAVPTIGKSSTLTIHVDAKTLFSSASVAALDRAVGAGDVSVFNPITVQSRASGKPFYAILHRNDAGLMIDLEPIRPHDTSICGGPLQSHRLGAKAILNLQSLPGGEIGLLCDTVVKEVHKLTGFDRVMAYKFHDDEHGEVVAEMRRSDLEPYLGLHYPATDIPQAARFLFMKNRVRMIYDCRLPPVRVIQDTNLLQPLSLTASTLRAPHACHAQYMLNMESISSFVMAVIFNDTDVDNVADTSRPKTKLWGLVVCHHTSPRFVPFPLRSACEFLMQVFSLQLNMEVGMAAQVKEKHILQTQTLLCDMLLRDAPIGIVSQSPNIMDLVKCDGAALYYGKKCWLLGTTPTEAQIADIAAWLLECHRDSTGLSTDSLEEAGCPRALGWGEAVCGMAAAKITSNDFLLWFRSHTAKEIKWGGAKHNPEERDDGRRMHPRSSFKTFLEVIKGRSLPWEDVEMDAIHSLQLILRGSFRDIDESDTKTMIHARLNDLKLQGLDELSTVASEMVRLIETATAPILAVNAQGHVNGWNRKVADLTGLPFEKAIGRPLAEIVHEYSMKTVERARLLALEGKEEQDIEIHLKTEGEHKQKGVVILIVNACCSRDVANNVVGVCFIGQDVTGQKLALDRFIRIQGDYKAIVQSPNPLIPPIFGADEHGFCSEWNMAMEKLSGWRSEEVLGKMLVGEIFGLQKVCCHLCGQDAVTSLMIILNNAVNGGDCEDFPFVFFDRGGCQVEALLIASKRTAADGRITGVFCFLHTASPDLLNALRMKGAKEKADKELSYIREESKKPLEGLSFTRTLLEGTELSIDQRQLLKTYALCEIQLRKLIDDDVNNIEEGRLELETSEFVMESVINSVISQGVVIAKERGVHITTEIADDLKTLYVLGDQVRLNQVLANLMLCAISHSSPSKAGHAWVRVEVSRQQQLSDNVHFRFSIAHSGLDTITTQKWTAEGLGLSTSFAIIRVMKGEVVYTLDSGYKTFIVNLKFPLSQIDRK